MSLQSNYERGKRIYWVPSATMAMLHIGGVKMLANPFTMLRFTKPKDPENWWRVYVDVVRTQKDIARTEAKMHKMKKRFAAKLAAHVKTNYE